MTIKHIVCLLALAVGCTAADEKPTQLMVVVNSNFERELAGVVLRVGGKERARVAVEADGGTAIPFSFGVVPPSGDARAKVTVEAEALSADDLPLACPARAHVGFVAGESRVVQLELTRACGTSACACDASQTCLQGECISAELDVRELPAVEPGRELDGIEKTPSTTLPEPERPVCNADNGAWSDIERGLSRNHDGQLCPVMSDGTSWGSAAHSLEMSREALRAYLERTVEVEHDVITLHVVQGTDALRVSGLSTLDAASIRTLPTLQEVLQLPVLRDAEQPLQLVVRGELLSDYEMLPRLLIDSGVVRRCRPIYLTASGAPAFAALRQLRDSLRTQPRWSMLWDLTHFGRRVEAGSSDAALGEVNEAVAHGFDRIGIDAKRVDLPFLRRKTREKNVLTHFFNMTKTQEVVDLCDGSSGLEALLNTERPPEIRYFDELRFPLSSARTLLELDVSRLEPGATTFSYQGIPELSMARDLTLGSEQQPALVTGDRITKWGDTGTVLRFSAAREQRLALHDATFNEERRELKFFAWPIQSLIVTARLPVRELPAGARQVIVSKLRGESGWALQFINEGAGSVLQYLWYGKGREDSVVIALKGSISVASLPMQFESPYTIFVQNHCLTLWQKEQNVVSDADMTAYYQHVLVTNDAPITLGADPDGGGYFDGDIVSVKVSAMYGAGKNFLVSSNPND